MSKVLQIITALLGLIGQIDNKKLILPAALIAFGQTQGWWSVAEVSDATAAIIALLGGVFGGAKLAPDAAKFLEAKFKA